ncbi:MAG: hypothetical protein Q7R69_03070 [bacterium]|nr:hypothetical protein [bacterium]
MNATRSIGRVIEFLACTLPVQVATSTVAADIAAVELDKQLATSDFWRPRLACARRMLSERRRKETEFSASIREAAHKRYLAHRSERAEEQRRMAAGMGAGSKKKKG